MTCRQRGNNNYRLSSYVYQRQWMFRNTEAPEQNCTSNKTQGEEAVRIVTDTGRKWFYGQESASRGGNDNYRLSSYVYQRRWMFRNTEASEQNRSSNQTQGEETVRIVTDTSCKWFYGQESASRGVTTITVCRLMFIRDNECLEMQRLLNKTALLIRQKMER